MLLQLAITLTAVSMIEPLPTFNHGCFVYTYASIQDGQHKECTMTICIGRGTPDTKCKALETTQTSRPATETTSESISTTSKVTTRRFSETTSPMTSYETTTPLTSSETTSPLTSSETTTSLTSSETTTPLTSSETTTSLTSSEATTRETYSKIHEATSESLSTPSSKLTHRVAQGAKPMARKMVKLTACYYAGELYNIGEVFMIKTWSRACEGKICFPGNDVRSLGPKDCPPHLQET